MVSIFVDTYKEYQVEYVCSTSSYTTPYDRYGNVYWLWYFSVI